MSIAFLDHLSRIIAEEITEYDTVPKCLRALTDKDQYGGLLCGSFTRLRAVASLRDVVSIGNDSREGAIGVLTFAIHCDPDYTVREAATRTLADITGERRLEGNDSVREARPVDRAQ